MTEGATSQAAVALPRPVAGHRRLPRAAVVAIAMALVAGGVGGYALSQHRAGSVRELTGNAHVGAHQAWIDVGGWQYGFTQTVPLWIDTSGTTHEDGWPDCLRPIGAHVRVRFGEVPVTSPTGIGLREIVWVDCRG